jgi:excisionase family DNA binding protein
LLACGSRACADQSCCCRPARASKFLLTPPQAPPASALTHKIDLARLLVWPQLPAHLRQTIICVVREIESRHEHVEPAKPAKSTRPKPQITERHEIQQQPDGLLTVTNAAKLLSLSRATLYQLMDSGQLPYVKIGGSRRIKKAEVLALIGRCEVGR